VPTRITAKAGKDKDRGGWQISPIRSAELAPSQLPEEVKAQGEAGLLLEADWTNTGGTKVPMIL
jgi:hypothetical protein